MPIPPDRFRRLLPLPPMALFALASTMPLGLLVVGLGLGGLWVVLVPVYVGLFSALADQLFPLVAPDAPEGAEFPAADALLVAIGLGHLIALPVTVWAVAGDSGLSGLARGLLFLGMGQAFGQVSNPAAHELIHRGGRGLYRLGVAVYVSLLNGHHASAHRLVHHRFVATPEDPSSAPAGMGYWRFLPRAWGGSFRAGLRAEAARGNGRVYGLYLAGALGALGLGHAIAGWAGVAVWAGLAGFATAQLIMSDYVQHYGLVRRRLADGRHEPASDRHSWNAPHWFSAAMMLNAPRHSDHHAHPARPYPALRLPGPEAAPWLPYSLPLCSLIALVPPVWRRMMKPRLKAWEAGSKGMGDAG